MEVLHFGDTERHLDLKNICKYNMVKRKHCEILTYKIHKLVFNVTSKMIIYNKTIWNRVLYTDLQLTYDTPKVPTWKLMSPSRKIIIIEYVRTHKVFISLRIPI